MGFLSSLLMGAFPGTVLKFVSSIIGSLTNEKVAVVTAQTGLAASEATAVVNAEIERQKAFATVQMAQMTHPVWWWAWALFVFPAGAYVALIHVKSVTCAFFSTACTWNIPEVPKQIESWDSIIVLSFFGLAAASSVVQLIAGRLGKAG